MKFDTPHQSCLQDLLEWRRDVRHFDGRAVPQHLLDKLKDAMELAPSVGNARPWRVLRIETPALRQQIRDEFEASNADAAQSYQGEDRQKYDALKLAGLDIAPVQLAIFTETVPEEGRGLGRKTMPETLAQSTSMAIFSLWLTARSHNLGVGMVSILDPQRVIDILDVPATWQFNAYLCIGYPSFTDDTPLLHRAGWQENTPTLWQKR